MSMKVAPYEHAESKIISNTTHLIARRLGASFDTGVGRRRSGGREEGGRQEKREKSRGRRGGTRYARRRKTSEPRKVSPLCTLNQPSEVPEGSGGFRFSDQIPLPLPTIFTVQAPSPAQPLSHRSHRATKSSEQVKSRAFPAGKPQSTNHRSGDGSWCSRTCPHKTQTTRGQHDKSALQALTSSTQRALEMSWSSTQTECYVDVALHARFTAIGDGL